MGGGGLPQRVGESQVVVGGSQPRRAGCTASFDDGRADTMMRDSTTQTVEQRSIGVQVGVSGSEVSSTATETEPPLLKESRVQTTISCYEFWCLGKWQIRSSTYLFEERKLMYAASPLDDKDPFMGADGLLTALEGNSADTTEPFPDEEEEDDESSDESMENEEEEEKEDEPVAVFIADDGKVVASEEERLARNKHFADRGLKILTCRSRSINRPARSHSGHSSRRRESCSPIRVPT